MKRQAVDPSALGELVVLSFSRAVGQLIMPVNKPTFAYKLAVEPDPRDSLDLSL